jgi:hypothetical protein
LDAPMLVTLAPSITGENRQHNNERWKEAFHTTLKFVR